MIKLLYSKRSHWVFNTLFFLLSFQFGYSQTFYKTYPDYTRIFSPELDITTNGYLLSGKESLTQDFNWNLLNTDDQGNITDETSFSFAPIGTRGSSIILEDGSVLVYGILDLSGPDSRVQVERRNQNGLLLDDFSINYPAATGILDEPKITQLSDGTLYMIFAYSEEDQVGPPDMKHFIYAQYDLTTKDFIFQSDVFWSDNSIRVSIPSIQETGDGKLLVYVYDEDFSNRHYLIKQEYDGTEIWRVQASSLERPVSDVVTTPSGGMWYTVPAFSSTWYYSSDASERASFDIGPLQNMIQGEVQVRGIIPRSDDGALLIGKAFPNGGASQIFTALVSKTGETEQFHLLDLSGPTPDDFENGFQLGDGYVITGHFGAGTPFILKLDTDGKIENAPSFIDLELDLTGTDPNPDIWSFHSVTLAVENTGNIAATGVKVSIPQGSGSVYEGGNVFTATQGDFNWAGDKIWDIGTLAAGASASITINYFKNSSLPFGQYAEVSMANETDVDSSPGNGNGMEAQEDDEALYGASAIDFSVSFSNVPNRGVAGGGQLAMSYSFQTFFTNNLAASPVQTAFYLSSDKTLDNGDLLIGTDIQTVDENNPTGSNNLVLDIPSNISPGIYHLIVSVDDPSAYIEIDEVNNISESFETQTIIVTGPTNGLPDLIAGPVQFGNGSPYAPGDFITGGSYYLFNTGEQATEVMQLAFFLSTDENLSPDDIFIRDQSFGATFVLNTTPQSMSVGAFVPDATPSGQYYVLIVVDETNVINESDEVNNVRASSNQIIVSNGTDPCDPDNTNPVFTNCPQDINLTTTGTTAIANWTPPSASDACPGSVTISSTANPGDALPIGNTSVTYTAEDASGNLSTCTFTVRVMQVTPSTCNNNILNEPGFENGFGAAWLNIDGGGEETSDAYSGNKAMQLTAPGQVRIIQAVGAATAGETYTLSSFAKISDDTKVAYIYVKFMSATYQPIVTAKEDIIGQSYSAWQVSLTAPPNTAFMEVGFEKATGSFTASADEWCLTTEGSPQACTITAQATNVQCDDNNTPDNPGDDTFSFSIIVNSSGNCSGEWEAGTETGQYGTNKTFGPYLIANGPITLNINDKDNPGASTSVDVNQPIPCSNGSGNLADLRLSNFNASGSATIGAITNYTFDLNNQGNGDAVGNFTIKAYFSTDDVLSSDDVFDGLIPTGNLGAGQTTSMVPGASTVPTSLTPGNYFLILKVDADETIPESNENNNTIVSAITLTTGGSNPNCDASSDFPWEDWISRVQVGNVLDQVSSKTPYSDYTGNPFPLMIGENNSIELTSSFSYFTYDEYWRVWIDWNGDSSFDANEIVFEEILTRPANGTASKSISGNFTLPASANTGMAKMRVIMTRDAFASPCGSVDFGEVEDYLVNISNTAPNARKANPALSSPTPFSIYPNPANDLVTIELNKETGLVEEVLIFDQFGKMVFARAVETNVESKTQLEIELTDFIDGTYFLQLRGEKTKPMVKRLIVQSNF